MSNPRPMTAAEWRRLLSNSAIRRRVFGSHDVEKPNVRAMQGARFAMRGCPGGAAFLLRHPYDASFEPFCVIQNERGELTIFEVDDLPQEGAPA